ncbi:inositol-pentakisphosphate 2-kinase [Rhagoletis pomonella]|uniref:inositol-pentakisphosphate 2-kinase n=1 Tax=Rhagoletis pomonella TaxID=28610 RepID=UPI001781D202|nr:inositol-pentakisphosphate 2-kinase [Rhagoletis pomonella]
MASDNIATTDISQQEERQQDDNSRMAIAGWLATPTEHTTTTAAPQQQKHQQEQGCAEILEALLGIAVQTKTEMTTEQSKSVVKQQQPALVELSQIELIYRAEGNANLVLALPQFKKVLRLPKTALPSTEYNNIQIQIGNTQQRRDVEVVDEEWQQHQEQRQQWQPQQTPEQWQLQRQQKQEQKRQEVVKSASDSAVNQNAKDLTMEEFVAYIEVIRNLLGNEYIFETEIVRIAKEEDKRWINEQIRPDRPAHRQDKEFCGEFGLLLPDATRLPIAFDILVSNLQAELIGVTYAIEIKPKQGWLLPTDVVNNLFDLKKPMRTNTMATATATAAAIDDQKVAGTAENKAINAASSHVTRCRFCAMQYLKLRAGKINRRTSYCPMMLFSGVPARMLAALDALLRCPQNNLRIFRNGISIYDSEHQLYEDFVENYFPSGQIELLKDLVVACLLRDYTNNNNIDAETSNRSSSSSNSGVSDDDVVDVGGIAKAVTGQPHLNATQKSVAQTEAESEEENEMEGSKVMPTQLIVEEDTYTVAARAARLTAKGLPTKATTTTMTARTAALETTSQAQITEVETLCLPKNCVLQKVLHLQLLAKRHMTDLHAAGYANKSEKSYNALKSLLQRSRNQPVAAVELNPTEAYLLGATALDCSIMLAFQEISLCNQVPPPHSQPSNLTKSPLSKHCVVMPCYGKTFLTKVTLVDLDPKPDSHLCKYIKQTSQALNVFTDGGSC